MEVYPLQDTLPPRHQVESDESEDEDVYSPGASGYIRSPPPSLTVNFNWRFSQQTRSSLLVALYEAGRCWAQGVGLGDARGDINLNTTVIGRIYTPQWADTLIIVIDTKVPLYAMHAIATTIISSIAPKSLCLIDSYPLPSYVSVSTPSSNSTPPIRRLQTHAKTPLHKAELLSTPNILQCLVAAFLSLAEFQNVPATLLLLPSSYMTPSAPPSIVSGTFGPSVREEWETDVMEDLHKDICATLGTESVWKINSGTDGLGKSKASRKGDIGEGSMYL